ncbi:MAG: head decoration protein [Oceanisphaera sp.]|uniref:head decoration protein n=1 Tax=Oceanisphaera sp. TaxID=1929979 RepID=UPI003C793944
MALYKEPRRTGEHVLSEASGSRSREQVVLAAGNLPAGAVLALDAAGDYVELAPDAVDTTNTAVAVLYAATDATVAPAPCVVNVRDCEVIGSALGWPAGIDTGKTDIAIGQLVDVGIIVR